MSEVKKTAAVHQLRDNLDSVHSMAALVRMMGHEVEFAINGFAALDVARKFRPDVIHSTSACRISTAASAPTPDVPTSF